MPEIVYIGLGSNLGNRVENIQTALRFIAALPDTSVTGCSSFYENPAREVTDQPDFVNAVAEISTMLYPESLLHRLLNLESGMGRVRTRDKGPRTIDLDLLLYGDRMINTTDLIVPHPRMLQRDFVLIPLSELASERVVPGTGRTVLYYAEKIGLCSDLRKIE